MLRQRYDISFDSDGSVRFLPWLLALMVYLAALAIAGMLLLSGTLSDWNRGLAGVLTVELPPAPAGAAGSDPAPVLDLLRDTPGVLSAQPLSRDAIAKLVEPWLGSGFAVQDLALPRLIDLRVDPDHPPDLPELRAKLAGLMPEANIEEAHQRFDKLFDLAVSVELTALAIVILIAGCAIISTIFTARAGLAVHHDVIEILHLLGAHDAYITRQFGRQALLLALRGGIVGLGLAIVTLLGLGHASAAAGFLGEGVRLLPVVTLRPWHWAILVLLPFAAALIARVTARLTVARALARMP